MGYPRAAGMADYTASGTDFIPEVWSPRIQLKFYKKIVSMDIANTWYEGEIKNQGDTVNIRAYPDITISDYYKGQQLDVQVPESTPLQLLINKGKYFCVHVDDVDEAQSDLALLNMFSEAAGKDLAVAIDQDVLQNVYSDADSSNIGATAGADSSGFDLGASGAPLSLTSANILDAIIDANTVLDEQDVPDEDRYIVLPPVLCNLISKSDLNKVPCYSNMAA